MNAKFKSRNKKKQFKNDEIDMRFSIYFNCFINCTIYFIYVKQNKLNSYYYERNN